MWPWRGPTRHAASSRRRAGRNAQADRRVLVQGRPTLGSWATTRLTALCCAVTPARSASWPRTRPLPSPGLRHGCWPPSGAPRRCGPTGRWPRSSPRSRARAAGWRGATPGRSGCSPPRWPGRAQDRRAEAVRPAGPSSGSPPRTSSSLASRCRAGGPRRCRPASRPDPVGMGPGRRGQDLEAVDRGSPCGKRDYAIILLVTRLGLRLASTSSGWSSPTSTGRPTRGCPSPRPRPAAGCSCRC